MRPIIRGRIVLLAAFDQERLRVRELQDADFAGVVGRRRSGFGTTARRGIAFDLLLGGTWNKFDSDSIKSKKVGQNIGTPPEAIGFRCAK